MKYRLAYNIFIFLAIALFVWPVYTALLVAGIFLFRKFYESIVWLIIIEILYGPVGVGLWGHYYVISVLIVFGLSAYAKYAMRYYE